VNLPDRARTLLDFWFGPPGDPDRERHRQIWFRSTPEFDAALHREFLGDYEAAAAGRLMEWEGSALAALALVLLLDQVPRNIFRDTPRAYATDPQARRMADRALARDFDRQVPPVWRRFFYMPFHHSEDLADQRRSLILSASLPREDGRDGLGGRSGSGGRGGSLRRYGRPYLEVIERFGRFPHRNTILGRPSTAEEIEFMEQVKALRSAD